MYGSEEGRSPRPRAARVARVGGTWSRDHICTRSTWICYFCAHTRVVINVWATSVRTGATLSAFHAKPPPISRSRSFPNIPTSRRFWLVLKRRRSHARVPSAEDEQVL